MEPRDEKSSALGDQDAAIFKETLNVGGGRDTAGDAQNPAEDLNKSFGRYRIERTLGAGAMGAVYLAYDGTLERQVALKIPKFPAGSGDEVIKRFYREARSAAAISHPNICGIYDVGEFEGTHYIAMQYVEGHSLADYVDSQRQQPQDQVAMVVRKVAVAMHEAHSHNLVHRDLKPANIMIDQRGEPVVMDFGLAKRGGQEDVRITREGSISGSPAYMSPEQLEGKLEDVDPRADIYSLGVVLYEGLTGQIPFQGSGSILSLIRDVITKTPQRPDEIRRDLDPRLCEICIRAMARNQQQRFQSMRDMVIALDQFLQEYGQTPAVTQEPRPLDDGISLADETDQSVSAVEHARDECKTVRGLLEQQDFEEAMKLLKKIAAKKDLEIARYTEWAAQELPRVRNMAVAAEQAVLADVAVPELPPLDREGIWRDQLSDPQASAELRPREMEEVTGVKRWMQNRAAMIGLGIALLALLLILIVAVIVFSGSP
jgi:serine/threonine protein kinase